MAMRSRKPDDDAEAEQPLRQLGLSWAAGTAVVAPATKEAANEAVPELGGKSAPSARESATEAPRAARAPREPLRPEEAPTTPAAAPAPRIYGVTDLVRAARLTLEARFTDVRVEGELSGLRRTGPGHLYFTLKDDVAALDCVLFTREASKLRFKPEDGLAVRLRGRLTIFEGRGKFQMTVVEMEPTGAGALAFAFEQLKRKLAAEGLFETGRKRALPFLPRCIGIVTSPHGAVIRDIIRVAHRRFPVALLLAAAPVQGPGSAGAVVAALTKLAAVPDVDVIILARGGGSLEDLWTFNEEVVARAIAACPKPVISAIGHETDFTIADFVADLRAPTPSAAAELAIPLLDDLRSELGVLDQRLRRGLRARTQAARLKLEQLRRRLGSPRGALDQRRQRLDDLAARLHRAVNRRLTAARQAMSQAQLRLAGQHPHRRIEAQRALLGQLRQRLQTAERRQHDRRRHALDNLRARLVALSPLAVLERGYSLARLADGRLLTNAADVDAGARLSVVLRRGTLEADVISTLPPSSPSPSSPSDSREPHDPSSRSRK